MTRDRSSRFDHRVSKSSLDETPSIWIVGVSFRQGHDNVQVVRQDHDRVDCEWMRTARVPCGNAQRVNVVDQHPGAPVQERHGKEKRSA
jgi:hypothetical protein